MMVGFAPFSSLSIYYVVACFGSKVLRFEEEKSGRQDKCVVSGQSNRLVSFSVASNLVRVLCRFPRVEYVYRLLSEL